MTSAPDAAPRFRFIEVLGRGSFGTVYLADMATSRGLHQRVAVKVLHFEGEELAEVVARHRDEARLLAQLNHDHVVKVFDLVEVHGRPALVMEFVEGVDTETVARSVGRLSPRTVVGALASVAGVLHAAHHSISPLTGRPLRAIHRDIKPANLLLTSAGLVKVLDFGVAKADFDRDANTRYGRVGTPTYMSPENWEEGEIGPETDIYALGLTAIRLLSAKKIERIPTGLERHLARVRELVDEAVPESDAAWGRDLRALLEQMLARAPAERPTASEVESRCVALLDQVPGESLLMLGRRIVPELVRDTRRRLGTVPLPEPVEVRVAEDSALLSAVVDEGLMPVEPMMQTRLIRKGLLAGGAAGLIVLFALAIVWWRQEPASPVAAQPSPEPTVAAPVVRDAGTQPVDASIASSAAPAPSVAGAVVEAGTENAAPSPRTKARSATRKATARCPDGAYKVSFSADTDGSVIVVDGQDQGALPKMIELCAGRHEINGGIPERSVAQSIEVGPGQATSYTLRLEDSHPMWREGR